MNDSNKEDNMIKRLAYIVISMIIVVAIAIPITDSLSKDQTNTYSNIRSDSVFLSKASADDEFTFTHDANSNTYTINGVEYSFSGSAHWDYVIASDKLSLLAVENNNQFSIQMVSGNSGYITALETTDPISISYSNGTLTYDFTRTNGNVHKEGSFETEWSFYRTVEGEYVSANTYDGIYYGEIYQSFWKASNFWAYNGVTGIAQGANTGSEVTVNIPHTVVKNEINKTTSNVEYITSDNVSASFNYVIVEKEIVEVVVHMDDMTKTLLQMIPLFLVLAVVLLITRDLFVMKE